MSEQPPFDAPLEPLSTVILRLNADWTIRSCNIAVERTLAYRPDELVRHHLLALVHHEDRVAVRRALLRLRNGRRDSVRLRCRLRRRGGTWCAVDLSAMALPCRKGRHRPVVVIAHDGSTHPTSQAAEAAEQGRILQRVADHVPVALFRFELLPQQYMSYVSAASSRIAGYAPEEYYANPHLVSKTVHPDDRHLLNDLVYQASEATRRVRWHHRLGSTVWSELYVVPVFDAQGTLIAFEGVVCDVTERAELEVRLLETARLLVGPAMSGQKLLPGTAAINANAPGEPIEPSLQNDDPADDRSGGQPSHPEPPQLERANEKMAVQAESFDLSVLTPQEQRILPLLGRGLTNRQIARELFFSENTVKTYVSNILHKLGLERRAEVAALLWRPTAPNNASTDR